LRARIVRCMSHRVCCTSYRDSPRARIWTRTGCIPHCPHVHRVWARPLPRSAPGLVQLTLLAPVTALTPCTMTWRVRLHCTGTGLAVVQASRWGQLSRAHLPPASAHDLESARSCRIHPRIRARVHRQAGLGSPGPGLVRLCSGMGSPQPRPNLH
jgi:hypothetical protein